MRSDCRLSLRRRCVVVAIAAGSIIGLSALPALASDPRSGTETLFIDGVKTDVQVMPDFELNDSVDVIGKNGKVLFSNLKLSSGDSLSKRAPRSSGCPWRTWAAPATYTWHTSVNGCSLIGTSATTFAGYDYSVDGNSQGRGCLKGRGYYYQSYPGGGSWYQTYRSIGCASGGSSGGGKVLWGKVASVKKVQMYAASAPVGAAGMFR